MSENAVEAQLSRIAESVDILVKIALEQTKGDRSQKEMILFLDSIGVAPGRIADLLGTTTENVYPTLSRARKGKSLSKSARGSKTKGRK